MKRRSHYTEAPIPRRCTIPSTKHCTVQYLHDSLYWISLSSLTRLKKKLETCLF